MTIIITINVTIYDDHDYIYCHKYGYIASYDHGNIYFLISALKQGLWVLMSTHTTSINQAVLRSTYNLFQAEKMSQFLSENSYFTIVKISVYCVGVL